MTFGQQAHDHNGELSTACKTLCSLSLEAIDTARARRGPVPEHAPAEDDSCPQDPSRGAL